MTELQTSSINNKIHDCSLHCNANHLDTGPCANYRRLLEAKINLDKNLPPPPVCLEVIQGGESITIGTLGNFLLVIGKPKSKKTFFMSLLMATALKNGLMQDVLRGTLPLNQRGVLFFDTEQGEYHASKVAKRVLELAGVKKSKHFHAFGLREFSPKERLTYIESGIYHTPNVGLVVIDGLRDLVSSINDEEKATEVVSKLLKWSKELNIHIVCVLHQNKADNNARGHLGTEAQNKAETVLSVAADTKSKQFSNVKPEYCRDKDFKPFAFEINKEGLPFLSSQVDLTKEETKDKPITSPLDVPETTHTEILKNTFSQNSTLKREKLLVTLQASMDDNGIIVGETKVRDFLTWYLENKKILRQGTPRSPNAFYELPA